jgi:hypothetical protein
MAKKITPPGGENEENENEENKGTEVTGEAGTGQVQPPAPEAKDPGPVAAGLLETFCRYGKLYIDSHGGVYTEDTPENIRGNAVLYDNPFYRQ